MMKLGFESSTADPCLYVYVRDGILIAALALYTDDVVIAGENNRQRISDRLMSTFEMTEGGTPEWLLGIAIDYDREKGTLRISQQAYVNSMLSRYGMVNCNPSKTPAATARLTAPETPRSISGGAS